MLTQPNPTHPLEHSRRAAKGCYRAVCVSAIMLVLYRVLYLDIPLQEADYSRYANMTALRLFYFFSTL